MNLQKTHVKHNEKNQLNLDIQCVSEELICDKAFMYRKILNNPSLDFFLLSNLFNTSDCDSFKITEANQSPAINFHYEIAPDRHCKVYMIFQ